jgi:serine-type D-Ala-D-Ala carboxypeptidase (penicillin-binding protein 5/6)
VLLAALTAFAGAGTAVADQPRPTVDPSAPTPTAPHPGRPPQGAAPDGSTVGGEDLDTRGLVVAEDAPPLPDGLTAAGWLVADAGTGAVLAARDPHGRYYPASTLKTLTLLTLLPLLDPARVVAGTVADEQMEGSRVGLVEGGQYPVALLFRALMLQSGNDVANALARAAGGVEVTVAAMNSTAERLGAFDTVVGTPSGLDVAGQSSSPYDLALIFRALVQDPAAVAVLTTPTADMPPVEGRSAGYQIQNQNPLLGTYEGNLGGKSGFTDAARHTFVTAAERNGRRLVVSVMATENTPLRAADQARLLLDWGFALPAGTEGVGVLVAPGEVPATPPPTPSSTPSSRTTDAPAAAPEHPMAAAEGGGGSTVIPVAVVATAALLLTGALAGLRRLRRPGRPGSPPRSSAGSRSRPR